MFFRACIIFAISYLFNYFLMYESICQTVSWRQGLYMLSSSVYLQSPGALLGTQKSLLNEFLINNVIYFKKYNGYISLNDTVSLHKYPALFPHPAPWGEHSLSLFSATRLALDSSDSFLIPCPHLCPNQKLPFCLSYTLKPPEELYKWQQAGPTSNYISISTF